MTAETTHDALLQMIASYGDVLGYLENYQGNLDQAVVDYAALATNLRGVVKSEMDFTATIDPDDPAPDFANGGTFNTVQQAVSAAPPGASVELGLMAGKTHEIAAEVTIVHQFVKLFKRGEGADPKLAPQAYATQNRNAIWGFLMQGRCLLALVDVDVVLPMDPADPALIWSILNTLVRYGWPAESMVTMTRGRVTGAHGCGIVCGFEGCKSSLLIIETEFDGNVLGATRSANGIVEVTDYGATLLNGAALQ